MKKALTVIEELNALDIAQNLPLVNFLLGHLQPTVAWGGRLLTPRTLKPREEADYTPLDALVQRVVEASENRKGTLSQEESQAGLEIFNKLQQFYSETDQMWSLARLWDYYSNGYGPRRDLSEKAQQNFLSSLPPA